MKIFNPSMLSLRLLFTSIYLPVNSEDPDETAPELIVQPVHSTAVIAQRNNDSFGTTFAVSLPKHYTGDGAALYLLAESRYDVCQLYIEAPFTSMTINQTVYKGVTRINLNTNLAEDSDERPGNGFVIQSQEPVSMHLVDYVEHSADGILLLPITDRNTDYYVVTPNTNLGKSQISVTTVYDNTNVHIAVKTKSGSFLFGSRSYSNGEVISTRLNRLQSIQVQHNADLTGTRVYSNNPISVVSGDNCVDIPSGSSACDHIMEQLPPVSTWGVTFVITHLRTRGYNTFKILSANANTRVKVGTIGTYTLGQGQSIEKRISHDSPISLEASQPILVAQFSESTEADNHLGDPFMAIIPSVQHFSDSYAFKTPDRFSTHHLTITIHSNQVSGLRLNGNSISRTDEQIVNVLHHGTNLGFSLIRLDLAFGDYNLTHTGAGVKFGALLYGFGDAVSYGYSLGYDINVIQGVRLVNGNTTRSGVLQVNVGGTWGHVCADGVGIEHARVICRSLGYGKYPLTYAAIKRLQQFTNTNALPQLRCSGNEVSVGECELSYKTSCSLSDQLLIDCAPQLSQIVQSQCTTASWSIDIDMDKLNYRFPGSVDTDIYMGDNSCHGTLVGQHLLFNYDIHSCLTAQSETNANLVYSNQLVYAYRDPVHPFIIRNYNWTLDVTCLVRRNESTNIQVAYNQSTSVNATLNTTVQYKPEVKLFSDPNYINPIPGNPIHVPLGTNIYVKTYIENIDWSIRMKLKSCYTTPSQTNGATKYYIIRNGCEVDLNTHLISEAAHESRFVFSMFEMTANHQNLYLHCDATICDTTDSASLSQCNQHCGLGR